MIKNSQIQYLNYCLAQPAVPSIIWGSIFSGLDAFLGQKITVRSIGKVTLERRQIGCFPSFYDITITIKLVTNNCFRLLFILPVINVHFLGSNIGFIYLYNALQCPMEVIHGRRSLWHNILSAGTLGYIGVSRGLLGVPFVHTYTFYRYPSLSPGIFAFATYGALGGFFGAFSGKNL